MDPRKSRAYAATMSKAGKAQYILSEIPNVTNRAQRREIEKKKKRNEGYSMEGKK
jgi:hypothetical protein